MILAHQGIELLRGIELYVAKSVLPKVTALPEYQSASEEAKEIIDNFKQI